MGAFWGRLLSYFIRQLNGQRCIDTAVFIELACQHLQSHALVTTAAIQQTRKVTGQRLVCV